MGVFFLLIFVGVFFPLPLGIFTGAVFFFQGHPHHHRQNQKSRVAVHPCELDLRSLVRPQVFISESGRDIPFHDHLAGITSEAQN